MHLELPTENSASRPELQVKFPQGKVSVWPSDQRLKTLGDERIFGTVFQDTTVYHADLIARLNAQAYSLPATMRGSGGKKIRDAETWNLPGFQLLMQRAIYFFCRCHAVNSAHVLDRWANVMQQFDYSTPHAHYDAQSAVVYFLETGEIDPQQPMDGTFEIIDSRVPFCCPYQAGRPMRGLTPVIRPGMMILFPAEYIHHVRPYFGRSPRMTIAWNISPGPPPQDRIIDPTKTVPTLTQKS